MWDFGDIVPSVLQTRGAGSHGGARSRRCWPSPSRGSRCGSAVSSRASSRAVTSSPVRSPESSPHSRSITVAIRCVPPLYQTVNLVLFAYVLLFMPRAMVNVRSGLAQVPIGLEEASRSLGRSPTQTFVRVTLRLTAPAAAAGASLVFVGVATELTATLLLGTHRHPNAGDALLVAEQRAGLRGGGPLRTAAGAAGSADHAGAVPAGHAGGRPVSPDPRSCPASRSRSAVTACSTAST